MIDWLLTHTPLLYLTQSLWRDEAFSVLMAEHTFLDIIRLTIGDFTPPLYYFLLKIWIGIFGRTEIAVRMLSFIFHIGTVYVGYVFTRDLLRIKLKQAPFIAAFLLAINPMLLYFAFEARTFSLVTFLVLLSFYFFVKKNWRWHLIVSSFVLYSHPYSVFALMAQGVYSLFFDKKLLNRFVKQTFLLILIYSPWLVAIFFQVMNSGEMWYYSVDAQLVKALLGSMYLGYEGNTSSFWKLCSVLSLMIVGIVFYGLRNKENRSLVLLFLLTLFLPLISVVGFSFIRPIFTPRYLIYTTVFEVFLILLGLLTIPNKVIRNSLIMATVLLTMGFTIWYVPYHRKDDFQKTFEGINRKYKPGDTILVENVLPFFEAKYYAINPASVYVLRTDTTPLPRYVGSVLIPEHTWKLSMPTTGTIFLVKEHGGYETVVN